MGIIEYFTNVLNWLRETWAVWLIFAIVILAGYLLYWYLFEQRTYRAEGGKAQVKHGRLGTWIDLEKHLTNNHKESSN
jgi:hypothetical protein